LSRTQAAFKRIFVGTPKSSGELEHTLLPKAIALPVFSSDAMSSVAYATQEILLVLGLVGAAALHNVVPISLAVSTLLAIVVISYRQTVRAYPMGGGAYRVAHENLGMVPGLLSASALLIDYVLTVAVSVTAGVDAIVSAAEGVHDFKVPVAILFIALVAMTNLRGVRESGILFAIPTYGFIVSIFLLIGSGLVKCIGGCPLAESAFEDIGKTGVTLTLFVLLKAFSAGTTALTGVEAIADGVPAFRYPQSRNAATTLAIMGSVSISMFLGISWLAAHTHVHFNEGDKVSVVAQIAQAIFAGGPLFYVVQVMTAAILFLAANTAYQDFPRLSSILAGDRYMPRQFMNRGDRLVFSNGIIILSVLASLLIIVFHAELNRLIQLYLVGVFVSFTLSQSGMVVRWRRVRTPGWQRSLAINAFGAALTGTVLIVVVITKFLSGAWIVISAIPVVMYGMYSIHRHYTDLAIQLAHPDRKPTDRRPGHQHMVLLIDQVDASAARAVGYARSIRPSSIAAVTFNPSCHGPWARLAPKVELILLDQGTSKQRSIKAYLRERRSRLSDDDFLTVITPEVLRTRSLFELVRRPALHRLKASLIAEPGIQVLDIPLIVGDIERGVAQAHEPARNYAVVLVSGVNNAVLQAIEYAETLRPTDIRAVTFGLDPEGTVKIGNGWLEARIPHALEIEDAPFRDIGQSLVEYLRRFNADGINRVVTVVIPEFIVQKRRHQILHGQTALIVKRHLLFEPGVVVASVPYHIESSSSTPRTPV
jgi:amino acid transporter